jgi:hypothetical protein
MRLLVGTLYSAENEFAACCDSIRAQTHDNFEHVVIRDLPKREAHHALYGLFMSKADEYDLLVKIDADMVLVQRDFFRKVVARFTADRELDLLLVAVHDYFTDGLVTGVNIFRNTVRWNLGEEDLFTDRIHVEGTVRKAEKDLHDLAPAAWHCPDSGEFQAFHYGFHRGMKAVRGGKRWSILRAVLDHYRRNPEPRLALALLGADAALQPRFSVQHISYNDQTVARFFEERYEGQTPEQLNTAVLRSRMYWILRFRTLNALATRFYLLKNRRRSSARPDSTVRRDH